MSDERNDEEFLVARTRVVSPELLPELSLRVADSLEALWQELAGAAPPYWAALWVGGQAVARYVLDHPELVAGKTVLDVGTGSGVVAIAAARAGARSVIASDLDRRAIVAARHNASLNRVGIDVVQRDLLHETRDEQVILVGDMSYEQPLAYGIRVFVERHRTLADVLLGDPGRSYFARDDLELLAQYDVPVTGGVEGRARRVAGVYRLTSPRPRAR